MNLVAVRIGMGNILVRYVGMGNVTMGNRCYIVVTGIIAVTNGRYVAVILVLMGNVAMGILGCLIHKRNIVMDGYILILVTIQCIIRMVV